jgi:hypothetical protein
MGQRDVRVDAIFAPEGIVDPQQSPMAFEVEDVTVDELVDLATNDVNVSRLNIPEHMREVAGPMVNKLRQATSGTLPERSTKDQTTPDTSDSESDNSDSEQGPVPQDPTDDTLYEEIREKVETEKSGSQYTESTDKSDDEKTEQEKQFEALEENLGGGDDDLDEHKKQVANIKKQETLDVDNLADDAGGKYEKVDKEESNDAGKEVLEKVGIDNLVAIARHNADIFDMVKRINDPTETVYNYELEEFAVDMLTHDRIDFDGGIKQNNVPAVADRMAREITKRIDQSEQPDGDDDTEDTEEATENDEQPDDVEQDVTKAKATNDSDDESDSDDETDTEED